MSPPTHLLQCRLSQSTSVLNTIPLILLLKYLWLLHVTVGCKGNKVRNHSMPCLYSFFLSFLPSFRFVFQLSWPFCFSLISFHKKSYVYKSQYRLCVCLCWNFVTFLPVWTSKTIHFDKTWCEICTIWGNARALLHNFMQSLVITWRIREIVRWEHLSYC